MAKETMIVFVYDTEYCKDESHDPINAVLYFHPSWVSDVQKVALCGQLMGTTHFLKYCFFRPKIIALQNGKFVFKEFGRFLVAIGTDRNISDSLLEHRADLLASLIEFFHRDLQTIFDQFTASKYRNVSEKLYHIFGTYLPILQFNGNIFQNVPKLRIPKIASNIYLDAMQTLQSCQQTKGVLGGAILYHNKIVATQLSEVVTKNIVFTDPHRIKSTAETISVNFHVPVGVQMIAVYIPVNQYHMLSSDAYRSQNLQTQNLSNNAPTAYFQKRKMKRDRSIIFTNIPEENNGEHAETVDEIVKRNKTIARPTYLQLKEVVPRQLPEPKGVAKASEEFGVYPEFTGRTSVCSTPMTENKVLHGSGIMSICANPSENMATSKLNMSAKLNKLNKMDFDKMFNSFTSSTMKMERRNSFTDLQDSLKKISKKFSLKKNLSVGKSDINNSDELIESDKVHSANGQSPDGVKIFRATSDPVHPMPSNSNNPTPSASFDRLIEQYQSQIECEAAAECETNEQTIDSNVPVATNEAVEVVASTSSGSTHELPKKLELKTLLDKKMLSLPLKTHSEVQSESVTSGLAFERRRLSGIQLTPLMAKLSVLAFNEEKNSGFCNRDSNLCADVATPMADDKLKSGRRSLAPVDSAMENAAQHSGGFQKLELYICGQHNMTMFLLLEQGSGNKQEIVQAMFDKCVAKLSKMESHLYQTLNVNMMEVVSDGVYSLICLDSKWDTLLNSGPWSPLDQSFLEQIHSDLKRNQAITDILLRTNDCTLYGYKSGRTEFYFKESAHYFTGIPPPSDPMGTIATRAKARLEEDFSIVLF